MDDSPCAKPYAAFAGFHGTRELFDTTCFKADVFPTLVKSLLDFVWNIDDLRNGDHLVPAMNETIEDLIEPEAVLVLSIFVKIINLASVQDLAFSS